MRRGRRQKRKFICCIAQLCNLQESSTYFSPKKKKERKEKKYKSQAFATQFANNAGGMEELFGEGKQREKEMSEVFPPLRAANQLLFCTGCIQLRMCCDSAGLSFKGEDTGAPGLSLQHRKDTLSVPVSGGITLN